MTDRENKLIDMRIVTNAHLDKFHSDKKRDVINLKKNDILSFSEIAESVGEQLKNENDLVRIIQKSCLLENMDELDGAIELGCYLLAWDEIMLEAAVDMVGKQTIIKPWKPE